MFSSLSDCVYIYNCFAMVFCLYFPHWYAMFFRPYISNVFSMVSKFYIYVQLVCSTHIFNGLGYRFIAVHISSTVYECFDLGFSIFLLFSWFAKTKKRTNPKAWFLYEFQTFFHFFMEPVFSVFLFSHKSSMYSPMFLPHIIPRKHLWFHSSLHISNCFAMFFACGL